MSEDAAGRWGIRGAAVLFGAITLFISLDIVLDVLTPSNDNEPASRLISEVAVLTIALAGFVLMLRSLRGLRRALNEARKDAGHWREENRTLVQGLGMAINEQFAAWGLSDAERQVGLLLLKGLSLQEIADLRDTSERTAREQARAVYRKSNLSGRNELSAYFLEDLLPEMVS